MGALKPRYEVENDSIHAAERYITAKVKAISIAVSNCPPILKTNRKKNCNVRDSVPLSRNMHYKLTWNNQGPNFTSLIAEEEIKRENVKKKIAEMQQKRLEQKRLQQDTAPKPVPKDVRQTSQGK